MNIMSWDRKKLKYYSQLDTTSRKTVFLYVLQEKYPELFILLTSTQDINSVVLISRMNDIFDIGEGIFQYIEDAAQLALEFLEDHSYNHRDFILYENIAKEILFNLTDSGLADYMSDSISDIYAKYRSELEYLVKSTETNRSISKLTQLLEGETNDALTLLTKLNGLEDRITEKEDN